MTYRRHLASLGITILVGLLLVGPASRPAQAQLGPLVFGGFGPFSLLRPFAMAANVAMLPLRLTPFYGPVYQTTNAAIQGATAINQGLNAASRTAVSAANTVLGTAQDALFQPYTMNFPVGQRYPNGDPFAYGATPQLDIGPYDEFTQVSAFDRMFSDQSGQDRRQSDDFSLRPETAEEYFQLGVMLFIDGDYDGAAYMFVNAAAEDPTWAEAHVWSAITQLRGTVEEPRIVARAWAEGAWPDEAVRLFTGRAAPEDVLAAAERADMPLMTSTGPSAYQRHHCDAHFFVAQFYAVRGETANAREELTYVRDVCLRSVTQLAVAANRELERLEATGTLMSTMHRAMPQSREAGLMRYEDLFDLPE